MPILLHWWRETQNGHITVYLPNWRPNHVPMAPDYCRNCSAEDEQDQSEILQPHHLFRHWWEEASTFLFPTLRGLLFVLQRTGLSLILECRVNVCVLDEVMICTLECSICCHHLHSVSFIRDISIREKSELNQNLGAEGEKDKSTTKTQGSVCHSSNKDHSQVSDCWGHFRTNQRTIKVF